MFIGAYWSQRKESKESAAQRMAAFLEALAGCGEDFACWYSKGRTRATALRSPIELDAASIAINLKSNRRDTDRQPIPDLGYSLGAWNGRNISLSATIGGWSQHVGNAVVLNLGDERRGEVSYRPIMEIIVRAFDPDHAVVTNHEYIGRAGATKPWEGGLFTYHRGGVIEQHTFK